MTQLPPGISHLHLTSCHVEGAQLPASCRLRSLQLHSCNPGHAGATLAHHSSRAPINVLEWLETAQVQESVQVRRGVRYDVCRQYYSLGLEYDAIEPPRVRCLRYTV